jgi:hypothetical protein
VRFEEVAGLKDQEVEETAFGRLVGGARAALRADGSRCREDDDTVGPGAKAPAWMPCFSTL